jgi:predicted phosphodiesterase
MQIGLLADTHGFLDDAVFRHFAECDEIWHAGDFGTADVLDGYRGERFDAGRIARAGDPAHSATLERGNRIHGAADAGFSEAAE